MYNCPTTTCWVRLRILQTCDKVIGFVSRDPTWVATIPSLEISWSFLERGFYLVVLQSRLSHRPLSRRGNSWDLSRSVVKAQQLLVWEEAWRTSITLDPWKNERVCALRAQRARHFMYLHVLLLKKWLAQGHKYEAGKWTTSWSFKILWETDMLSKHTNLWQKMWIFAWIAPLGDTNVQQMPRYKFYHSSFRFCSSGPTRAQLQQGSRNSIDILLGLRICTHQCLSSMLPLMPSCYTTLQRVLNLV